MSEQTKRRMISMSSDATEQYNPKFPIPTNPPMPAKRRKPTPPPKTKPKHKTIPVPFRDLHHTLNHLSQSLLSLRTHQPSHPNLSASFLILLISRVATAIGQFKDQLQTHNIEQFQQLDERVKFQGVSDSLMVVLMHTRLAMGEAVEGEKRRLMRRFRRRERAAKRKENGGKARERIDGGGVEGEEQGEA